jgi:hypothetical protein
MANLGYRTFNAPGKNQKYSSMLAPPTKMTNFFNFQLPPDGRESLTINMTTVIPQNTHKKTESLAESKLASIRGVAQTQFSQKLKNNAKNFGRKKNQNPENTPTPIGSHELMNNRIDTNTMINSSKNFLGDLSKEQQGNQKDYIELENGFLLNEDKKWADGTYEKFLIENMDPVFYLREYFRENFDDKTIPIGVQMQRCLSVASKNKIATHIKHRKK